MMRSLNTQIVAEEGFSFVEVMVVSMLLGVILSAAYLAMSMVSTASDGIMARGIAQDSGQTAIERMTREIRQGQTITDSVGGQTYRFASLSATKIVFYADVDHNNTLDRVTYELASGQVTRKIAAATKPYPSPSDFGSDSAAMLLTKVDPTQTSMFTLLDKNGNTTAATLDDPTAGVTEVKVALRTIAHSGAQTATVEFPVAAVAIRSFAAGISPQ